METSRGGAAAATWIFRGDESRRRRGHDVEIPWRRVAAAPTRTVGPTTTRLVTQVISPADSVDTIPDGTTYENYVNSPNGVTNFGGTPTGVKPGQVTHTQGGGTVYNNQGMTTDVNQPLTSVPAGGTIL